MAKYIQIPTSIEGIPNILFNTNNIDNVLLSGARTFFIYSNGKAFGFTTSVSGSKVTVAAIYNAILAVNGAVLVDVIMPAGVVIESMSVS